MKKHSFRHVQSTLILGAFEVIASMVLDNTHLNHMGCAFIVGSYFLFGSYTISEAIKNRD